MATMTVSEARANLPELMTRVEEGEEITITRHGRPVAVLVQPGVLSRRRARAVLADAERVHDLLATARATPLLAASGLTPARAEELIGEIRAGRERR